MTQYQKSHFFCIPVVKGVRELTQTQAEEMQTYIPSYSTPAKEGVKNIIALF